MKQRRFEIWILIFGFWSLAFAYAPEDSNCQHLLDKQIAHYFNSWEVVFDSTINGMRTSQGCLDLLNWYIDLELRYEALFSKLLGIRYKNHFLGDYNEHISNHYFQPFFQLKENQRLFLSITTHYYKGEDEAGIGYFWGRDYVNFIELFFTVEDFDRNFSLQHVEDGREKIIYSGLNYPMRLTCIINKHWNRGRFKTEFSLSKKYQLESTDLLKSYREQGFRHHWYLRMFQDIGKFRLGLSNILTYIEKTIYYYSSYFQEKIFDEYPELQFAYRLNQKWVPNLYLDYNYKREHDTLTYVYDRELYERNVYAYLLDIEYYQGNNFVWHFGTQREFYYNNLPVEYKERRINIGLEYRYKKLWFYLVEAMEGDFPTPKYLHNHTYVQLMLRF